MVLAMINREYIDAYVEAQVEANRRAKRVDGLVLNAQTSFKKVGDFRKAASVTGSAIKRYDYDSFSILVFQYKGHEFVYVSKQNEEQEVA